MDRKQLIIKWQNLEAFDVPASWIVDEAVENFLESLSVFFGKPQCLLESVCGECYLAANSYMPSFSWDFYLGG